MNVVYKKKLIIVKEKPRYFSIDELREDLRKTIKYEDTHFFYRQYMKVYRLFFTTTRLISPYNIKNQIKWFYQRRTKGFSDNETWDLYHNVCCYILPRLKHLRDNVHGHPMEFKDIEEWQSKIDTMIKSFEIVKDDDIDYDDSQSFEFHKKQREFRQLKINNGMNNFTKYFENLWD